MIQLRTMNEAESLEQVFTRIHIPNHDRRRTSYRIRDLPGLGLSYSLRIVRTEMPHEIQVRLHMCIDDSERTAPSIPQIDAEPALGHERIEARGSEEGIEPGILDLPGARHYDGQARPKHRRKVRFACRFQKDPAVCRKGRGPLGVAIPHFLECGDVTVPYNPRHDLLDGSGDPGKAMHVVCDEADVHYSVPVLVFFVFNALAGATVVVAAVI